MKVITFKSDRGGTIEIKLGREKGVINARHSGFNPTRFGRYYDFAERLRQPRFSDLAAMVNLDHPALKAEMEASGAGFILLNSKTFLLTQQEVAQIRDAIKQLE